MPSFVILSLPVGGDRGQFSTCSFNKNIFFCSGEKKDAHLVEAKVLVEEKWLQRDSWMYYHYSVKQRQKQIVELALRRIQIPSNQNIKGKTR